MESFLSKVLGSQGSQSASASEIQKFGNIHILTEHNRKVQPVSLWESQLFSDVIDLENDLYGLPCRLHCSIMQRYDGVDIVMTLAVQIFDSFRGSDIPILFPVWNVLCFIGELVFAGYHVWDVQMIHLDSKGHSKLHGQSSVQITGGETVQPAQARAADEVILADEEGDSVTGTNVYLGAYIEDTVLVSNVQLVDVRICETSSSSMESNFSSLSDPVATTMPGG